MVKNLSRRRKKTKGIPLYAFIKRPETCVNWNLFKQDGGVLNWITKDGSVFAQTHSSNIEFKN